jgi:hypothetical protein
MVLGQVYRHQRQQQQRGQTTATGPEEAEAPVETERNAYLKFGTASLNEGGNLQRAPRAHRTHESTKFQPQPEPEPELELEQELEPEHEQDLHALLKVLPRGATLYDQLPRRQSPPRSPSRSPEGRQDLGRHSSCTVQSPRRVRRVPGGATMSSGSRPSRKEWADLT